MSTLNQQPDQTGERITFFNGFLRHPWGVGSAVPSSRFLKKHILAMADVASAHSVVELGPGTGGTTRAILDAMRPDASLLTIEMYPPFLPLLNQIKDPRLINHHGDACDLVEIIHQYQLSPPDAIISGIPFTPMPRETGQAIVNAVWQVLNVNGRFVTYQFWNKVKSLGETVFGPPRVELELLNIPPVQLSLWHKRAS